MEQLFFYFLKVVLCSGAMFLYYRIFLKDKTFHHYNRFYLLATLLVSLLLPLLKVNYFTIDVNQDIFKLLNQFQTTNSAKISTNDFNYYQIIFAIIALVSVFFIGKFGLALFKINQFKKEFPQENYEGISFYNTNLENAPFSFFKNLFWKNSILIQSDLGKQILKHEMVHIEQKHSYDKILIEILTAFFWFNPIFYLIKKEINLIHEYLADKKALKNSDTKAFAQMLLETHFSGSVLAGTSPFLNSNLKKRITMLKKSNTKFSYWRKVLALPLLFSLVFAYMVKAENREIKKSNIEIANAILQIKNDTIKQDTVKAEINAKMDIDNKISFEDKIKESSNDDIFMIGEKKVKKAEFLKYYKLNKANKEIGFLVDASSKNKIKKTVFSAIKFDDKNVAFGRVYDEKLIKKEEQKKSATTSKKNTEDNFKVGEFSFTTQLSISDVNKPFKTAIENSATSNQFFIDNKKVSKVEYENYFKKYFGNEKYTFGSGVSAMDTANPIKFFYAQKTENLEKVNEALKLKTLVDQQKFNAEAEKVKVENQDLTKTVAIERLNSNANPKQNNPWIVNVKAYPKTILDNSNVKYYVDGKLMEGSKWKEILPNNIKSINVKKDPNDKNGGIIFITTKDSPLEITPTQFDKIIINGKVATQTDLDKLNRDSIKTENIKRNTKNGKSFNEIRIRTK
ncbi:M56 family metallopeptidase [Halpernia sp.]|uniref:M56 family metallopeptidase n=1 Tax=Halpernia sp. TaxID=2782209 RepID=UPI003A92C6A6